MSAAQVELCRQRLAQDVTNLDLINRDRIIDDRVHIVGRHGYFPGARSGSVKCTKIMQQRLRNTNGNDDKRAV